MRFRRGLYGDYIYSPLTVTHARGAFRNLPCWLGIACLTYAVSRIPEGFHRINPVFPRRLTFKVNLLAPLISGRHNL